MRTIYEMVWAIAQGELNEKYYCSNNGNTFSVDDWDCICGRN